MRIIGGCAKGTRLLPVPRHGVRPTLDRVREGVFNVLAPRIEGASFLDVFAGTGAVGLEAISRGAVSSTFIERHPANCALILENARRARLEEQVMVRRADAFRSAAWLPDDPGFDLVYLDPPFEILKSPRERVRFARWVEERILTSTATNGLLLLEHPAREGNPLDSPPMRSLRYGETTISLFER